MRCPRCGQGELYDKSGFFNFKHAFEMKEKCSICTLKYEKENGFFYGAMYVSYMINIAFFITTIASYYLFLEDKIDWRVLMATYIVVTILLSKWIFRMSRSIWIGLFISYEPQNIK